MPNLASFFKNASRIQGTGGGLPVPTRELHRRVSRTDLDFEEALRNEGTMVLKEGFDVNALGGADLANLSSPSSAASSPSPMKRVFNTSPALPPKDMSNRYGHGSSSTSRQPSSPPTSQPGPQGKIVSSENVGAATASGSSTTVQDGGEVEEGGAGGAGEVQTKRRSLYRSPGTSSSPDLATLLRKAKERGGGGGGVVREKRNNDQTTTTTTTPPMPSSTVGMTAGGTLTRVRPGLGVDVHGFVKPSSSSSSRGKSSSMPVSSKVNGNGEVVSPSGSDWVMASPPPPTQSIPEVPRVGFVFFFLLVRIGGVEWVFFLWVDTEIVREGQDDGVLGENARSPWYGPRTIGELSYI